MSVKNIVQDEVKVLNFDPILNSTNDPVYVVESIDEFKGSGYLDLLFSEGVDNNDGNTKSESSIIKDDLIDHNLDLDCYVIDNNEGNLKSTGCEDEDVNQEDNDYNDGTNNPYHDLYMDIYMDRPDYNHPSGNAESEEDRIERMRQNDLNQYDRNLSDYMQGNKLEIPDEVNHSEPINPFSPEFNDKYRGNIDGNNLKQFENLPMSDRKVKENFENMDDLSTWDCMKWIVEKINDEENKLVRDMYEALNNFFKKSFDQFKLSNTFPKGMSKDNLIRELRERNILSEYAEQYNLDLDLIAVLQAWLLGMSLHCGDHMAIIINYLNNTNNSNYLILVGMKVLPLLNKCLQNHQLILNKNYTFRQISDILHYIIYTYPYLYAHYMNNVIGKMYRMNNKRNNSILSNKNLKAINSNLNKVLNNSNNKIWDEYNKSLSSKINKLLDRIRSNPLFNMVRKFLYNNRKIMALCISLWMIKGAISAYNAIEVLNDIEPIIEYNTTISARDDTIGSYFMDMLDAITNFIKDMLKRAEYEVLKKGDDVFKDYFDD